MVTNRYRFYYIYTYVVYIFEILYLIAFTKLNMISYILYLYNINIFYTHNRAIRTVWPTAEVDLVGSVSARVALPKSDLDFVVYFPPVLGGLSLVAGVVLVVVARRGG